MRCFVFAWAGPTTVGGSVAIKYVSSENLDFKEKRGKRYIHENYLSWIDYLVQDITRNLQNATVM